MLLCHVIKRYAQVSPKFRLHTVTATVIPFTKLITDKTCLLLSNHLSAPEFHPNPSIVKMVYSLKLFQLLPWFWRAQMKLFMRSERHH